MSARPEKARTLTSAQPGYGVSGAGTPSQPPRPPRIPKSPPPQVIAGPRIEALRETLASLPAHDTARDTAIATFWTEVATVGTPIVEAIPGDEHHRAVTFVWRDRHRDDGRSTRAVVLLANKVTDPSVWDQSVLHHLPGTDVWHRTYRMPSDWRATYQLAPDDGDVAAASTAGPVHGPRSRWAGVASGAVPDPFCRQHLAGKPGEQPSSVVELPDAPKQPWWRRRAGVPSGRITERLVPTGRLAAPRRVWTYEPATPSAGADLLVLLDGEDWAGRLDIAATLDNLIADGAIPPTVAVMVDAIDTPSRWRELTCDDTFVDSLLLDLIPWARDELDVSIDAAQTTLSGRSLGAITALYAGLRAPEVIGAVHAQSPSLWFPAEPTPDGREAGWLRDALASADALPAQLSIEVGRQEWMLLGPSRELARVLTARADASSTPNGPNGPNQASRAGGTTVRFVEYEGGHDAYCWRGGLADALADLAAART